MKKTFAIGLAFPAALGLAACEAPSEGTDETATEEAAASVEEPAEDGTMTADTAEASTEEAEAPADEAEAAVAEPVEDGTMTADTVEEDETAETVESPGLEPDGNPVDQ